MLDQCSATESFVTRGQADIGQRLRDKPKIFFANIINGDAPVDSIPAPWIRSVPHKPRAYFWALLVVILCTAAAGLLARYLAPTDLAMIYLLGVVGVALRFGCGPSIMTAVLGVLGFDFVVIPPRWSLEVANSEYLFTFAAMLLTGVIISTLVARVQFQVESGRRRERRTATVYAISRELAGTQGPEQIARIALRHSEDASDAPAVVLLPDQRGRLARQGSDPAEFDSNELDEAAARWVFEHGQTAGHGTAVLAGAKGLYWPLNASCGTVGVLGVLPADGSRPLDVEQIHLLEALAGLTALAIERAKLGAEAEQIRLEVQTEQLRSSLLSAVSHDLRTPLSVITGASSTLLDQDQSLEPKTRRALTSSILDESERLNRLVANLLDMTRLQAGALQVRKDWNVVEDVVGTALARMRRQLHGRPVRTHLAAELPLMPLDDLLIQQVLINLLENAVRYTPPLSEIDVAARMDGTSLVVEVADRGPGLPAADSPRLFEKFYRGATEANSVGAGLGLAICRGIVELHGGRIEAENRPDSGAIFRFWLPVVGQPPEQAIPEPVESVADATAKGS
jgi:two-component system sensor histidine kinase KdpD